MDAETDVQFIKRCVSLHSYSSSPGWKGYFCMNPRVKLKHKLVGDCINIVRCFCQNLNTVSAMTIYGTLEDHSMRCKNMMLRRHRDRLMSMGAINLVTEWDESIFDDDSSFHHDFIFSRPLSAGEAKSAMWFGISSSYWSGALFFVNKKNGVILYPHDDDGGGVGLIIDITNPIAELNANHCIDNVMNMFDGKLSYLGVRGRIQSRSAIGLWSA